jgi:hypothetical protein
MFAIVVLKQHSQKPVVCEFLEVLVSQRFVKIIKKIQVKHLNFCP